MNPGVEFGISVALCTYNGARFLSKQIDSILGQSVPPEEIVIRDDGSADQTLRIIESYGEVLTLLPAGERLGVTRNFEQAISACKGRYIALSDQDDIWEPYKLERLREAFEADSGLRLVGSNAQAIDEKDKPMGFDLFSAIALTDAEKDTLSSGAGFDALIKRPLFTGATVMFRRELLDAASPFPALWLHDEWLAIIAAATGRVRLLPDQLTRYRQHDSNVAGVKENTVLRKVSKVRKLIAPRHLRHQALLARRESLLAQLKTIDAPGNAIAKAEAALAHEEFRSGLPKSRALRIAPILGERRTGRYDSVDYGNREVLRDLLSSPR
ncbi:glycosyltransferase involved in cell wall biosynthesis [Pseudarthrobacter defluvii]|uniref:glycosyltransferase family 2 protein n=1 Tax=Pseudarthrobacter defluvii TaxID=410837 RepID=UPI0027809C48|nr:glycosyltransferase family 2 protein [Pseudarthrobacter defluvii]MDQ0768055.1 glycosyltransferase involved in cell wall biosynthesis [Pseudarthrobacter defluvii]